MAGGLAKRNTDVPGKAVCVTRPAGSKNLQPAPGMGFVAPDKIAIDIKDLLYTHADALNIPIKPDDIIAVSKADVVYVAGSGVRKPGELILEDRDTVTVIQALAMAEGLLPNAAKHHARIIRTKVDGSRLEIPADLDKNIRENAPDPDLAANDTLNAPRSGGKATLKKSTEAIVQRVSGFIIFHP